MQVYADHAATTPLKPEVLEAMMPYLTEQYGNASSMYGLARSAKKALEAAREDVANLLGVDKRGIYFTGSGTESNNTAIKGVLTALSRKGKHVITTAVEHHAIIHTLEHLRKSGHCELTVLPVDEYGAVSPDDLRAALRDDTVLVTIMTANNEIGTIQPIDELGAIARERGVWFHTDAVQAIGHVAPDTQNIDMLTLSAHKFGGPKGVGALYLRPGIIIPPLVDGGGHEGGLRSGTENIAGIVGLAKALSLATDNLAENTKKVSAVSETVKRGLSEIPYSHLTGHPEKRLPGTVSFVFEAVEGESLVLGLDAKGVAASSGSACSSGTLDPSHVLLAIGLPHEVAHGSLRLTFGEENTAEEAEYVVKAVAEVVARAREMSPLWSGGKPTERFWQNM
ncbi:MAG: cysteine desulfurase [Oscillospiraceae bacterium]|nr:cysteine desulfurase [Oscillospiraceae bacterium]